MQGLYIYLVPVGHTFSVVAVVNQIDSLFRVVSTEQVGTVVFVAGGDNAFQPQRIEFEGKILEEIADARVVAVAENGFPSEKRIVMAQFFFDVGQLGVELVVLALFGLVQGGILSARRGLVLAHGSVRLVSRLFGETPHSRIKKKRRLSPYAVWAHHKPNVPTGKSAPIRARNQWNINKARSTFRGGDSDCD